MKKFLSILLITTMVFGLMACGKTNDTPKEISGTQESNKEETVDKNKSEPGFKIGFTTSYASSPMMGAREANAKYMCEVMGGEAVFVLQEGFGPEDIINTAEQMIQLDVDAIIIAPMTEAPMARIAQLCDEAGVYYIWNHRKINDKEIKELCYASPYFLGYAVEDEYSVAYDSVKYMKEQGITNIALITENLSDTVAALREEGLRAAAKDFGVNVLTEFRGPQSATEVTEAVESFIAAYPELELVFVTGATMDIHVDGILAGCEQAKRNDIKIAALDFLQNADKATKDGRFVVQAGGQHVPNYAFCTATAIQACLNGKRLGDKPLELNMKLSTAYHYDDLKGYYDYVIGDLPLYTADEMKSIFFGTDATAEKYRELAENYSNNDVYSAHEGMEQGSIPEFKNEYYKKER